jgi:hypothetical protein
MSGLLLFLGISASFCFGVPTPWGYQRYETRGDIEIHPGTPKIKRGSKDTRKCPDISGVLLNMDQ